jgi:hypothetical protein
VRAWLARGLACLLAISTVVLVADASKAADRARVALVGGGGELGHAIEVALTPWGVALARVPADLSGRDAETIERARSLARAAHLDAVVWLAATSGATTLACVYEADADRLLVRALGASPPFDDTTAAAAALTVKAMLRSSTVAPPSERGAPSPADVNAVPPAGPTPAESASTAPSNAFPPVGPAPTSPAKVLPATTDRTSAEPSAPHAAAHRAFALEAAGGAHLLTTDAWAGRVVVGAAWTPETAGGFGVGADVSLGSGVSVQTDAVDARLVDRAVELSLRRRFQLGAPLALVGSLGAGLEWTTLSGAVGPAREPLGVDRFDPSLCAALRVAWSIGGLLAIGAAVDLAYLARTQAYLADGSAVVRLAPLQPGAMLWVGAAVF